MRFVRAYYLDTWQFTLSFFCALFASVYNRYRYEVTLTSTEEARAHYQMQKVYRSSIYKSIVNLKKKLIEIFTKYMVWVFHFCIFMGISIEDCDVFSVILFLVDAVVFMMHLVIEWNSKPFERNRRMRKWSIATVTVIGILIFCRYSAFYTRYYLGQSALSKLFKALGFISADSQVADLFKPDCIFYRLFSKASSSPRIYMLFIEFYSQLFYLTIASLTMISLRPPKEDNDDSSEAFSESDDAEEGDKANPPRLTGLSGFDNYFMSAKTAVKKVSKMPSELITNAKFVFFFIYLLLQRAITFTVIVYICRSSSNILDYSYILIELAFFVLLFHNLAGEFKAFGLEEFNEKNIDLFGSSFCKQLITFDPINENDLKTENDGHDVSHDRYSRVTVKDVEQNCFYVNYLLSRMQTKVVGLTTIISFIKMSIVAVKNTRAIYIIIMYMLFSKEMHSNIKVSMVTNTILNASILIELLTVKDYRHDTDTESLKKVTSEGVAYFCTMLQAKLDFYCAFINESLWENNRTTQISRMKGGMSSLFLQACTQNQDQDPQHNPEEENIDTTRQREDTIKMNVRRMGSTSSISKYFANFRKSIADPSALQKFFMNNVTKATKIKIEPSEILIREKKEKFDNIVSLYKNYKFADAKFRQLFQYDFFQTYNQFVFESPETYFANANNANEESAQEIEDEFDLGLNTYEKNVKIVMGVGTPRIIKILMIHKNKTKYNYCTALKGIQYLLRRILLIPVLYMVCIEPNFINLPLLLIGVYYTFKSQRTIITDIRFFMPIYSLAFFTVFLWNCLLTSSNESLLLKANLVLRPVPTECSLT